jgi:hypothetical protein
VAGTDEGAVSGAIIYDKLSRRLGGIFRRLSG